MAGEDLVKTLEGLGLDESGESGGGGGGDDGNILPIMQSIMQNLLSKEVLYPSLKEITDKVCMCFFLLPFRLSVEDLWQNQDKCSQISMLNVNCIYNMVYLA